MRSVSTALLVALFFIVIQSEATTRKVPQDFAKIQLAINAAVNGDTVLVSEGTYIENIRITKKIVVASLFIADNNKSHITNTIINGSSPSHPDSGSAVTIEGDVDTTTIIKGFTITGGKGNKRYVSAENIYAMGGGGIELFSSGGARISYNIIKNNTVSNTGSVTNTWAGGIGVGSPTAPYISDYTIIEYNTISYNIVNGSYGEGGGILWMTNGRVTGNNISNNFAKNIGGGISVLGGCNIMMSQNYISQNIAGQNGGGFFIYYYTITSQQPTLTLLNNIIVKNTAQGGSVLRMNGGDLRMLNNTIVDNSTSTYSIHLGASAGSNTVRLLNNIVWNPLSSLQITTSSGIYSSNNCVYGGLTGTDNISTDPSFALFDTLYHLSNTSPAIGVGISSASLGSITLNAPAKDYSGSSRPNPSWSKPDLGAMESTQTFPSVAHAYNVPKDFAKIQDAINASVNGDVVIVSEGTYKENLVINKKITLASQFYLDKDTSHISKTILDGSAPTNADSGSVIAVGSSTDSTTIINGFTITKGSGTKHTNPGVNTVTGGGIDINSGGATIKNNIIKGNNVVIFPPYVDAYGGGISILWFDWPIPNKYSIIESNTISENNLVGGTFNAGGGIEFWGVDGRVVNNTIRKNTSYAIAGIEAGNNGGYGFNTILLQGNLILENTASQHTGGIGFGGKGATGTIKNNRVINNKANVIGGVFIHDTCYTVVDGNYVSGNIAVNGISGGIYFERNLNNSLVVNNIVVNNTGCGVRTNASSNALVINNTIVGNSNNGIQAGNGCYAQAMNNIAWNNTPNQINGTVYTSNNLSVDPKLIPNDSLYHLSNTSPAIGAGILSTVLNAITLNAPSFDYFNSPRPRAAGSKPDIGAVENDLSNPADGVKELSLNIPVEFSLSQNYPNPFNPSTTIRYSLPTSANVKLAVYDLLGREVATLVNEEQSAGWKEVQWNAATISSGIYFYKIEAGNFVEIRKMSLIK